jgi:hypothetical protein
MGSLRAKNASEKFSRLGTFKGTQDSSFARLPPPYASEKDFFGKNKLLSTL